MKIVLEIKFTGYTTVSEFNIDFSPIELEELMENLINYDIEISSERVLITCLNLYTYNLLDCYLKEWENDQF